MWGLWVVQWALNWQKDSLTHLCCHVVLTWRCSERRSPPSSRWWEILHRSGSHWIAERNKLDVTQQKQKRQRAVCVGQLTHLQGDLPGPGVRHRLLTVNDAGVAAHLGGDGGGAAAWEDDRKQTLRDQSTVSLHVIYQWKTPAAVLCLFLLVRDRWSIQTLSPDNVKSFQDKNQTELKVQNMTDKNMFFLML